MFDNKITIFKYMENLGTFIHGIASTQALDSSGERIRISGIDDTNLTTDGVINWDHNNEQTSQIVGKILVSKKILDESDIENKHQRYFYEKIGKKPYLYVCAVLFDNFGHTGAKDLAAMYKFNEAVKSKDLKTVIGFSVEGSKLEKVKDEITRCIARKVSATITPCNKECVSQLVVDQDYIDELNKAFSKDELNNLFLKYEELSMDLKKADNSGKKPKLKDTIIPNQNKYKDKKSYTPESKVTAMGRTGMGTKDIAPGKDYKPKKTYQPNENPTAVKVGDRIMHNKKDSIGRTGYSIYNDPDTFKTDNKKYATVLKKKRGVPKGVDPDKQERCVRDVKAQGKDKTSAIKICNASLEKKYEGFDKVKEEAAKHGAKNPEAVAAAVGRKKYGKKRYNKMIQAGKPGGKKGKPAPGNKQKLGKAMDAGGGQGAPSTLTQGSALVKKSENYWDNYPKKQELVDFLSKKMPKLSKREILALAKTTVYKMEREKEELLKGLVNEK
ncbi:MAG: hypothetical protein D6707_06715 [Bacteroidetes bacterium]|nr:MAG: hypothetical protein D6707_06715 [Bacteroidota bacterium]